jgi:glycosyltransferase involved in cell wall biosynthesis
MKKGCICKIIFKEGGSGIQNFSDIPYAICKDDEEIKRIIMEEKYDFVDFINDLPLPEFFADLKYTGIFLFEIRGIRGYDKYTSNIILDKYIHAIIVPSRFIHYFTLKKFRFAKPVFILPNIVDLTVFKPAAGEHPDAPASGTARNRKKSSSAGWAGLGRTRIGGCI